MDEKKIEKLIEKGAKRWTKGGFDRLYVDAELLGLDLDYYKSGNISSATWKGEAISNSEAGRLGVTKIWLEIGDGKMYYKSFHKATHEAELLEAAMEFFNI